MNRIQTIGSGAGPDVNGIGIRNMLKMAFSRFGHSVRGATGSAGLMDLLDFKEAGFDGYEVKSVVFENISKMIKNSFKRIELLDKRPSAKAIKKILIIDDDDQLRKALRKMLEREGYSVSEASSGEEGCIHFFEQPADLIIIDLVMPGKSGIETVVAIKEEYPDIKIILMSGCDWYGIDAEFEVARSLGALTLKKPFARKSIREAIHQIQN